MYRPAVEPLESRVHLTVVPSGFTQTEFVAGLSNPTAMAFAPDGRLFVSEQGGTLRVVKNGVLLTKPFLTLNVDSSGERGLLGVTFDPDFATDHFIYVYWTVPGQSGGGAPHNRVSRFTASSTDPDVAAAGSEHDLLDLPNLSSATNHNGGGLHFGPDGKLYVSVGENANADNSQSLATPLGKMLRINADGSIPTDNPFYSQTTGTSQAIWATGLRNPYTFAFQPGTGRMFIDDVGNNTWEEIDEGTAGANYGWPATEGPTTDPQFQGPLYAYQHDQDGLGGCAIVGGTFYNPSGGAPAAFPTAFDGQYFFADYCGGYVNAVDVANGNAITPFATDLNFPVDVRVGTDGALYALNHAGGTVDRFAPTDSPLPPTGPDLVPTITTPLPSLVLGKERGHVIVRVNNVGNESADRPVAIGLFLSSDGTLDAADPQLVSVTKTLHVKPGAARSFKIKFTYPVVNDGSYQVLAQADVANAIAESDETNNVAASDTAANVRKPVVDFSGTFQAPVPNAETRGGKGSVVLSVLNAGNIPARGPLQISLYASTDSTGAAGIVPLTTVTRPTGIKPGARRNIKLKFTTPQDLVPGTYFFSAAIDSANVFDEPNEGDNLAVSATSFDVA
ncbi:MAG TPA: PQQ-dependent sugar dehydrogenase [Gemmataceae bacterium]|nr:PQQ-dependent sugar dehydrogenase [Gemmataceae bacterium]